MEDIAIIPARSGSKGVKNKNIKDLGGKPLMAYSIEAAIKSKKFHKIFVSTDSQDYADIAEQYGADASFLRSAQLSVDSAGSWDAVREVIDAFERESIFFKRIMLLQPTSPFRTFEDILSSYQIMEDKQANAVISVVEAEHSPLWCNTLPEDGCMDEFRRNKYVDLPRQMLPKFYRLNGAIYLVNREEIDKTRMFADKCYAYIMPQSRSVDIDTELDFVVAECLLNKGLYAV